jgi:5-methylcytosine-specific restriction endonuclease McrA
MQHKDTNRHRERGEYMIMNLQALRTILRPRCMAPSALDRLPYLAFNIQKEKARDYRQEYREYHGKPSQIKERAQRNAARSKLGLKPGDPREVDHKHAISDGGSNSKRNLRAVSRETNRKKGAKKE